MKKTILVSDLNGQEIPSHPVVIVARDFPTMGKETHLDVSLDEASAMFRGKGVVKKRIGRKAVATT